MNPKLLGTVMAPKVLIYVDDGTIDVRHTPGVEVAVIVEGEDVQVPDDWVGLSAKQHHSLPITINRAEMPQKRPLACDSTSLTGTKTPECDEEALISNEELRELNEKEEATRRNVTEFFRPDLVAPYCTDCDGHHEPGQCPGKTEGWVERGMGHMIETTSPDLMKAPYCYDCDGNHPVNIGCDGLPKTCSCCGASYGQVHSTGCADQNVLVEGGTIFR